MNLIIIVATHKFYWMPKYEIYFPLHVGKKGKRSIGFHGDDTGSNISERNANYCELTGVYWAWKNLKCDVIGLCHYTVNQNIPVKGRAFVSVSARIDKMDRDIKNFHDLNQNFSANSVSSQWACLYECAFQYIATF